MAAGTGSFRDGAPILGVEHSASGRFWRSRVSDERLALAIAQAHDLPEVIGRVLAARGVTAGDALQYMAPSLRDLLPDPSILPDMDAAADRLATAAAKGEAITVFGDYDVDGATSSALLVRYFRAVGVAVETYIPDRLIEGYGPNTAALRKLAAQGVRVVVTVDCGTLAFEPLAAAAEAGLDVIVIDHHMAEPELPQARAVVNPNRLDATPGLGQLPAVGVAFLLAVAVNRALRKRGWFSQRQEPSLLQWLDLVALGTVCDMVPITGLNRAFVAQGLKIAAQRNNIGIAALADIAGVRERMGCYHLGFLLGPRVNAGGRIGRSDLGTLLLSTEDPGEAMAIAQELHRLNADRRTIEAGVQDEALRAAATQANMAAIVVAGQGWHPGVVGIVATRVKDAFNRPAVVIGLNGGVGKGSGRSVPGFDLGAAVIAARQAGLLEAGGGHAMAAGLTIAPDRVDAFHAFLEARAESALGADPPRPSLGLDGALAAEGATTGLVTMLERAGPYGQGNREPRFALPSLRVVKADIVGTDHVRVILSGGAGGRLKGIAFRSAGEPVGIALLGAGGRKLHVAGTLRADTWQGRDEVQLQIDDVAPAD